ncbi:Translation initiation factor IF-3 [bioreactor metagenome]|uniref:Translation initiation factor IF-3 n=1 Tax=bioreactor metagenome TaxID=1076179 RepID=A0A645JIV4_9ZZZZ
MNFGKLCYEQKKKLKDQKKNQQAQKVKEIKFRLNIAEHDYAHKISQGVEFLGEGCKLKVTITFKGREMAHTEIGFELVKRIMEDLKEYGVVESPAKLLGKNINLSFNPKGNR